MYVHGTVCICNNVCTCIFLYRSIYRHMCIPVHIGYRNNGLDPHSNGILHVTCIYLEGSYMYALTEVGEGVFVCVSCRGWEQRVELAVSLAGNGSGMSVW